VTVEGCQPQPDSECRGDAVEQRQRRSFCGDERDHQCAGRVHYQSFRRRDRVAGLMVDESIAQETTAVSFTAGTTASPTKSSVTASPTSMTADGMATTTVTQPVLTKQMAPRFLATPPSLGKDLRSELRSYAGIHRVFGTAVGADDDAVLDDVTHAEFGIVVEAKLVLPVAPGDPDVDEVGVLRSQKRLAGVEGQTDRFAVELGIPKAVPGGNRRKCGISNRCGGNTFELAKLGSFCQNLRCRTDLPISFAS
jgi:hypothetical protein